MDLHETLRQAIADGQIDEAAAEAILSAKRIKTDALPLLKIEACRQIVARTPFATIDNVLVDVQSANAIVTVYDALSDKARQTFLAMPIHKMGEIAWKLVTAAK